MRVNVSRRACAARFYRCGKLRKGGASTGADLPKARPTSAGCRRPMNRGMFSIGNTPRAARRIVGELRPTRRDCHCAATARCFRTGRSGDWGTGYSSSGRPGPSSCRNRACSDGCGRRRRQPCPRQILVPDHPDPSRLGSRGAHEVLRGCLQPMGRRGCSGSPCSHARHRALDGRRSVLPGHSRLVTQSR